MADSLAIPTRPEYGTKGRAVTISTNFFACTVQENKIFQYHVTITPQVESRRKRQRCLAKTNKRPETPTLFDGNILYTQERMPDFEAEVEDDGATFIVEVKFTKNLSSKDLPEEAVMLFNILIRRVYRAYKYTEIQRRYFDMRKPIFEDSGIRIFPGITSAINRFEGGRVLLNLDKSSKLLRGTVLATINGLSRHCKGHELEKRAEAAIVGQVVITVYNNRTYFVDRIDWKRTPSTKFTSKKDNRELTIADYMRARYSLSPESPDEPLIVAKSGRQEQEVLLLSSCCFLTGYTDEMVGNFNLMRRIKERTGLAPRDRERQLSGFIQDIKRDPKAREVLDQWGISVSSSPLQVPARILEPETVMLKNQKFPLEQNKPDWTAFVHRDEFVQNIDLEPKTWVIVFPESESRLADDFLAMLRRVASQMKIRVGDPIMRSIRDDRTESYISALEDTLQPTFKLAVFIEPTQRKDRYDAIKKFLFTTRALPSQCLCSKTLSKPKGLMSVCLKVCIQIQAKCGGEVWKVDIPLTNTMIVGIDVYHDTVRRGESVLAFCATYNSNYTQYFAVPAYQSSGQEIADCLARCMTDALKFYKYKNQCLPSRIFVYRDGVGNSQIPAVSKLEIPQLLSSLKNFDGEVEGGSYAPELCVILVQKRINARFFSSSGNGNPVPGTIVDRDIVRDNTYDFYLVAQQVTQGSATPAHFQVLFNRTSLRPDYLQLLTFKLCHTYYNWTGTVRVPAPCQYAHKLAFMIGQTVHTTPHSRLMGKLYFL